MLEEQQQNDRKQSMSHDPHEYLAYLQKAFGTNDPHTRDQIGLQIFTTKSWHEREDIIARTDQAVGADDGVSLRRKSQLMDFGKKLKTANAMLRKIGR
jgi:hypothetical protein